MTSPFPGMNPYLEQDDVWHDFHERFLPAAAEAIGTQVQPDYIVKIDEHVYAESFIELVCVVELLSPSNKRPGPNRSQYLAKRRQILNSPAHLVEIDLLRDGEPKPWEDRPACTYSVMVSRAVDRPEAGFWSIGLRDRLPSIPIPLRPPHDDARLDIQAILHRVYDAAGYQFYIYEGTPSPGLGQDDAAWSRQFLPPPTP
jgi:hypothetical protein